tara:strand:- start:438 stop:644 length:207 start_codon:yes stop_codon:yes gene_type:complete
MYDVRVKDKQRLGVAGFLTEFGAVYSSSPFSNAIVSDTAHLADKYLDSWTYWDGNSALDSDGIVSSFV